MLLYLGHTICSALKAALSGQNGTKSFLYMQESLQIASISKKIYEKIKLCSSPYFILISWLSNYQIIDINKTRVESDQPGFSSNLNLVLSLQLPYKI